MTSNDVDGGFAEFRTGWKVVMAAFAGLMFGAPTLASYSIGLLAPELVKEFGWSFSFVLSGLMVVVVAFLPLAPLVGVAVDRYGPRRIGSIALVTFGLSYMGLALSTGSQLQYWLTWVLIALSGVGATAVTFTRAIAGTFAARRGLALGIALSGTGFCVIFLKLTGQPLIDAFGWRTTVVMFGALPILIAMPLVLLGTPRTIVGASSLTRNAGERHQSDEGLRLGQILRGRTFWILVLAFVPVAFGGAAFPNLENIFRHAKVPHELIPVITALIGASMIIGRIFGGYIIDQIWAPLVAFVVVVLSMIGCLLLSLPVMQPWQAATAAILLGLSAGVEIDLLAFLVVRYLGLRNYGVIYGLLFGLFMIVAGGGPTLMGYAYDQTGSYSTILWWTGWGILLLGSSVLLLGRYPEQRPPSPVAAK
ncbi:MULTISPECIES: MFS transporter [unclassified Sphingomonas]|uniref:MFS transporter n=1 Tax=unclassified Sphingomonas TaxID=196159 RepID=UPI0006FB357A|nr:MULTISPECIES: MFS transporter [unclassified Sphingomonas]KQX19121.1 hypothetical protein ASD17_11170 [Sphingomonas sp. Root1294]KQY65322.1 hypothetical protein ASD39_14365 [Sphingomonas sp. Root50]KRB95383.1 hypothetical protein ASE22_05690 [Sphingomonas sp. Root720]